MAKVVIKGDKRARRNLALLESRGLLAVEGALFEVSEDIVGDAKELVPVDLGVLKNSGFAMTNSLQDLGIETDLSAEALQMARNTATEIRAVVGFGGQAVRYAEVQHEALDFHHTVGQAKYLEQPFNNHVPTIARRIGQRLDREVRKLGVR